MSQEIKVPPMGESITEATVADWHFSEGPITGQLHLPTAIYWNEPGSDSEFTDSRIFSCS